MAASVSGGDLGCGVGPDVGGPFDSDPHRGGQYGGGQYGGGSYGADLYGVGQLCLCTSYIAS